MDNDEKFKKQKEDIKPYILKLLNDNDATKFDYSEDKIYCISSKASKFENEDVSPDGKRLRTELKEILVNIKLEQPLDLFNKHSGRFISFKANFLRNKIR